MKCPFCGDQDSKVVDSRRSEDGQSIRRRRECLTCLRRFTTYEMVESLPIIVIKRDGSRQNFDRTKILNSMIRAFDKRKALIEAFDLDGFMHGAGRALEGADGGGSLRKNEDRKIRGEVLNIVLGLHKNLVF